MKRLLALVVVLVLLCGCATPVYVPTPTPEPPQKPFTVAFLGSQTDLWCTSLYPKLTQLCTREGWALLAYDCKGNPTSQQGQAEELCRTEAPDLALLYAFSPQDSRDRCVTTLTDAGVPVITLNKPVSAPLRSKILCHIGPRQEDLLRAAADHLALVLPQDAPVAILGNSRNDPLVEKTQRALEGAGLPCPQVGYTWEGASFGYDSARQILEAQPDLAAFLTFSAAPGLGAFRAVREGNRAVTVLSLETTPATLAALRGETLSASAAFSALDLWQALEKALSQAAQGEKPENTALPILILTPDSVDALDLGIE